MILLRSFLSGHIRIKRTLEYYDAGIGPRVPFGGGFGPTVSANFAIALGDYTTLSTTSSMPDGGLITRAGNAMLYDSTGKLTWAPNNLVLETNTFATSGGWYYGTSPGALSANTIVAPDGNTTASAYTWGTTVTDIGWLRIKPTGTYNASTALIYSIWVKVPSGTKTLRLCISDWSTTTSYSSNKQATTSWQRLSYAIPAGTLQNTGSIAAAFMTASGSPSDPIATGDVLHVWGPQLEQVTYQTAPSGTYYLNYPTPNTTSAYYGPRFDYDPATLAAKGLLVEGTRTNYASYTENLTLDPSTSWVPIAITVNSTPALSPSGEVNAYQFTETSTNATHYIEKRSITYTNGQTYTVSAYVKKLPSSTRNFALNLAGGGGPSAIFSTTTGALLGSAPSGNASFVGTPVGVNVGGGWFRFSMTFLWTGATGAVVTRYYLTTESSSGTPYIAYLGDGTGGVYLWGVQVEIGAFASSYIPNGTSSVSGIARAAETFTLANYQNRLVESFYIDEATGGSWSANINASATSPLTISTPTFGWVTSLRAYTNAYAGDIATPSWIDNSGTTGNRTYYDSTGMLTYAPANLAQQSADVSAAFWASGFDAGNTTTSTSINFTSASGYRLAPFSSGVAVGQTYIFSVVMSSGTKTTANLRLYDSGGGAGANTNFTLTSTPTRYSIIWTTTGSPTAIYFGWDNRVAAGGDGTTGTINVSQMQVERVTYQTSPRAYIPTTSAAVYQPRYDYDPSVTPATPRGMLIEESRVNLATFSEQFDNAGWTKSSIAAFGSGSISNATTAPDGTQGADYVVAAAASATHAVYQSVTVVASTTYTVSFYAKKGAYTKVALYDIVNGRAGAWFNLDTGAFIGSGGAGYTSNAITSVGNGWYRCVMTFSASPTTFGFALIGYPDSATPNAAGFTYTGDAVSGVYLWGAQLEAGSFATSYIPTTTGSVTRVADVVKLSGAALTALQGSAGSAAVQTYALSGLISINAIIGDSSNYTPIQSVTAILPRSYTPASAFNGSAFTGSYVTGQVRTGLAWNSGSRSLVANNATVVSGAGGVPVAGSTVFLGSINGSNSIGGWAQSIAFYNQKLPDPILKQKSVVNSPY